MLGAKAKALLVLDMAAREAYKNLMVTDCTSTR
jgi:hypothetical protein